MDELRTIGELDDGELSALMQWRADGLGLRQIATRAQIDYREVCRFFKEADNAEDANAAL